MDRQQAKELLRKNKPKGLVINFTDDYTISLIELTNLSRAIKELRKEYIFIRDFDLINDKGVVK
tara:strand:- start:712 stop:903 length:192 start_codon:yes stop_codon:yes gene_type:complete